MAKRRMIDPSIWDDPDVGELSHAAFRLFVGMFSNADDEGRLLADPRQLKKIVFGYRDDVTIEEVRQLRAEVCARLSNALLYEAGGREYVQFANWTQYQNIAKDKFVPSKHPGIDQGAAVQVGGWQVTPVGDTGGIPEGNPSDTEEQPEGSLVKNRVVKNRVDIASPSNFDLFFDEFWGIYRDRNGKKIGKERARALAKLIPSRDWDTVLQATRNYASLDEYPVDPPRFFQSKEYPNGLWREHIEPPLKSRANGHIPRPTDEIPGIGYAWEKDAQGRWKAMKPDPVTGLYPFGCTSRNEAEDRNEEARRAFIEARDSGRKEAIA